MAIFFHYGFDAGFSSEQAIETKSGHGSSNLSKAIEETMSMRSYSRAWTSSQK
jgi:hypothetical protein